MAAVYFDVEVAGDDVLLAVSTSVAALAELHETVMDSGAMTMGEADGGVALAAGEPVRFEPGGYHVMLVGLAQPLDVGETFTLTLDFEHAGSVVVPVEVTESPP